jgi:DNA-binding NarL/FixJ family response regulator
MVAVPNRRLLVVEDDERVRGLLGTALCPPGWEPVLAGNATEALAQLRRDADIGVALVDLGLPDLDGVELIKRISAAYPLLPAVVLTVCTEERKILEAFRAGARGYLFKEDLANRLAPALEEALAGGAPMSRAVARLVLAQVREERDDASDATKTTIPAASRPIVTERERQVIEQLARGLSYSQVAGILDISSNTVRSYIRTIYEKLAVCSKTEAVLVALRLGIVSGDSDERA